MRPGTTNCKTLRFYRAAADRVNEETAATLSDGKLLLAIVFEHARE